MSYLSEYIRRKLSMPELESELLNLISEYNRLRHTYLLVYTAAIEKRIPDVPLDQVDFYIIRDLLADKKNSEKIDIYIETPGGRGETAEEIVRFLHGNFDSVSFIISGEAKSAGTIIALSGDEILMTETGSLGPIDAQMQIGRSIVSAYDYIEWVEEKRKEAQQIGKLNPFDATMVAQITPGELGNVSNALEFAKDLVIQNLTKYKFKQWKTTETRKLAVTQEMKERRAKEIAEDLTNRSRWRLHGRSIKISDLDQIGLKVTKVDDNPRLAELVYRIQTVCRLLFTAATILKIFATEDEKIFRHATVAGIPQRIPQTPDVIQVQQACPSCGKIHRIYAKFARKPQIDSDMRAKGFVPFPEDAKIECECGFVMDLLGVRNEIEGKAGRKIITSAKNKGK